MLTDLKRRTKKTKTMNWVNPSENPPAVKTMNDVHQQRNHDGMAMLFKAHPAPKISSPPSKSLPQVVASSADRPPRKSFAATGAT